MRRSDGSDRAILFDLDGTLIEEVASVVQAQFAVAAALRVRGHDILDDAYRTSSARLPLQIQKAVSVAHRCERIARSLAGLGMNPTVTLVADLYDIYMEARKASTPVLAQATDLLRELQRASCAWPR